MLGVHRSYIAALDRDPGRLIGLDAVGKAVDTLHIRPEFFFEPVDDEDLLNYRGYLIDYAEPGSLAKYTSFPEEEVPRAVMLWVTVSRPAYSIMRKRKSGGYSTAEAKALAALVLQLEVVQMARDVLDATNDEDAQILGWALAHRIVEYTEPANRVIAARLKAEKTE
jgi:hypothetical protein